MKSKDLDLKDIENRRDHCDELINFMPLKDKIKWAEKKIIEFFQECKKDESINEITVSFSGGKDSTVLLDLVMKTHEKINFHIPIVMVYAAEVTFPSTFKFINMINQKYMEQYPDRMKVVQIVNPKKTWDEILTSYGYPIFSKQVSTLLNRVKRAKTQNNLTKWFFGIDKNKTSTAKFNLSKSRLFLLDDYILNNWVDISSDQELKDYFKKYNEPYFFSEKCCNYIKGNLKHDKRPSFIGTMAQESTLRKKSWIQKGCNIYTKNKMKSRPLSIWSNRDIWDYIRINKLLINKEYGFDPVNDPNHLNLKYERLGCTSCPYGSFMEQKHIDQNKKNNLIGYKTMNRFEILLNDYPNIYKSQVIYNGMYKILIDMGIKIENDHKYMKLFELRHKQIDDWYRDDNFRRNLLKVMCQIENHKDYKNKGEKYTWSYTLDQFNQAMNHFGLVEVKPKEITEIRNEIKKQWKLFH